MAFEWLEDAYWGSSDTILGDLLGSTARSERKRQEAERARREAAYTDLYNIIPGEHRLETEDETTAGQAEADPRAIEAQMQALSSLQQMGTGQYSDIDRARQQEMLQRNAIQERGQREAALSSMQARGMGRSGTGALASLTAQQGAANRASNEGVQIEALAQQRALQALQAQGSLAGQARGQSFDEKYRSGTAMDEWRRRNADRRNQFRQQEFENRQGVTDRRTGVYQEAGRDAAKREDDAKDRSSAAWLALLA